MSGHAGRHAWKDHADIEQPRRAAPQKRLPAGAHLRNFVQSFPARPTLCPLPHAGPRTPASSRWLAGSQEAHRLYWAALRISRQTLGDTHSNTLTFANNVAGVLLALGNTADAEPLYCEALAGKRAALGDSHPSTLNTLQSLAALYMDTGRPAVAEPLLRCGLPTGHAGH